MSIKDLEGGYYQYVEGMSGVQRWTAAELFIINNIKILINILKGQSDEIANLRQELAKKEDAIDWANPIVHERKK